MESYSDTSQSSPCTIQQICCMTQADSPTASSYCRRFKHYKQGEPARRTDRVVCKMRRTLHMRICRMSLYL